jgi:hypothetical protein
MESSGCCLGKINVFNIGVVPAEAFFYRPMRYRVGRNRRHRIQHVISATKAERGVGQQLCHEVRPVQSGVVMSRLCLHDLLPQRCPHSIGVLSRDCARDQWHCEVSLTRVEVATARGHEELPMDGGGKRLSIGDELCRDGLLPECKRGISYDPRAIEYICQINGGQRCQALRQTQDAICVLTAVVEELGFRCNARLATMGSQPVTEERP